MSGIYSKEATHHAHKIHWILSKVQMNEWTLPNITCERITNTPNGQIRHEKMSMHAYRSLGFRSLSHILFDFLLIQCEILQASGNSKQNVNTYTVHMCEKYLFILFGWNTEKDAGLFGIHGASSTLCVCLYVCWLLTISEMAKRIIYPKTVYTVWRQMFI